MELFLQSDVSASAKVLRLVRHYHGLPRGLNEEFPVSAAKRSTSPGQIWRTGARLNHLNARRRSIRLDDIPATAFPVVLELGQGSQFLLLREKISESGGESYIVQFSDARESLVRAERIREVYDGTCVFFRPRDAAREQRGGEHHGIRRRSSQGWFGRLTARLNSFSMKRGIIRAIACHVLTLAGVLGVIVSHQLAFSGVGADSLLVPAMGVFMAAAVVAGILRLRRAVIRERFSAALVDGISLPLYGVALIFLTGWAATPFFWVAAALIAVLLLSARLGQMPSRLRRVRVYVVGGTFFAGAVAFWTAASLGLFPPALMAGALILGACLVNLLIESDVLWQEVRLAKLTN